MTQLTLARLLKNTGCESQRDLARKLGKTQNCVWRWFRVGHVSADGALAIERLTEGRIAARKLRPDIRKAHNGKHYRRGAHRRPRKKARAS